ncbi:hypothetical protein HN51_030819 [Arachis hypogaea]
MQSLGASFKECFEFQSDLERGVAGSLGSVPVWIGPIETTTEQPFVAATPIASSKPWCDVEVKMFAMKVRQSADPEHSETPDPSNPGSAAGDSGGALGIGISGTT